MLEYDITDVSEDIDIYKTVDSYVCIICYYCYFFKMNFRMQPKVSDSCHDMT